jgi:hypothetical protein
MESEYVIGLAVAGWLATTWLAYRWGLHSKKLERIEAAKSAVIARRREFVAFLRGWRAEFDRTHLQSGGFARHESAFSDVVPIFVEHAELVRHDFSEGDRKTFDGLVQAVSKWTGGQLNSGGERYQKFLSEFDKLVDFVDAA